MSRPKRDPLAPTRTEAHEFAVLLQRDPIYKRVTASVSYTDRLATASCILLGVRLRRAHRTKRLTRAMRRRMLKHCRQIHPGHVKHIELLLGAAQHMTDSEVAAYPVRSEVRAGLNRLAG